MENLCFKAGYNRIIVQPSEVKADVGSGIVTPAGIDTKELLARFSTHPKQALVIAVGTLDERYEGSVKTGDQVILRLGTMVEPLILKGKCYGSVAPSDVMGVTTFHKDIKLTADADFHNKLK